MTCARESLPWRPVGCAGPIPMRGDRRPDWDRSIGGCLRRGTSCPVSFQPAAADDASLPDCRRHWLKPGRSIPTLMCRSSQHPRYVHVAGCRSEPCPGIPRSERADARRPGPHHANAPSASSAGCRTAAPSFAPTDIPCAPFVLVGHVVFERSLGGSTLRPFGGIFLCLYPSQNQRLANHRQG